MDTPSKPLLVKARIRSCLLYSRCNEALQFSVFIFLILAPVLVQRGSLVKSRTNYIKLL